MSETPHAFYPENVEGLSSFELSERNGLQERIQTVQPIEDAYHNDSDVKDFQKKLDKRMHNAKKMMLAKHNQLASNF